VTVDVDVVGAPAPPPAQLDSQPLVVPEVSPLWYNAQFVPVIPAPPADSIGIGTNTPNTFMNFRQRRHASLEPQDQTASEARFVSESQAAPRRPASPQFAAEAATQTFQSQPGGPVRSLPGHPFTESPASRQQHGHASNRGIPRFAAGRENSPSTTETALLQLSQQDECINCIYV